MQLSSLRQACRSGTIEQVVTTPGWTVDTLHVHLDQQFQDLRRQLDERFTSQGIALAKVETASERRFESVNEFRALVMDQQRTFITRAEFDAQHKALEDKLDDLTARVDSTSGGSASTRRLVGWGLAGLAIFVTIIVFAANILTGR